MAKASRAAAGFLHVYGMDYCGAKVIIIYRELYVPENYGVWMVVNVNAEFNRK